MPTKRQSKPKLPEKRTFRSVTTDDGKTHKLTLKEQCFCEAYLKFYGNGVQAVFEAGYKTKDPRVAAAIASENLRKPHIMAYVNGLLTAYGFNDDNVEKQHLFVLNQYADLQAKNKAIEMFYKLRGKFAPEKHQHTVVNLTDLLKEKLGRNRSTNQPNTD